MFLKDAPVKIGGWASGAYEGICQGCEQQFIGDKRAIFCLPCAHAAEVDAEREACAVIAENTCSGVVCRAADIAAKIREQ